MVNYREILRLHSLGQSQRTIRSSAHCSDNTVRTVLEVASQKGIQWPLDDDITNADLERMLFPDKYNRILSLKNSGVRELRSGNTVKEYKDSILVLKGGGNPDNDAFARIEVMELEKAAGYKDEIIVIPPSSPSLMRL